MKPKTFDCLAMKSDLQRQLLERLQGLPSDEQGTLIRNDLEQSPSPMGRLWRALGGSESTESRHVAEDSTNYGSNDKG